MVINSQSRDFSINTDNICYLGIEKRESSNIYSVVVQMCCDTVETQSYLGSYSTPAKAQAELKTIIRLICSGERGTYNMSKRS